jgi:L-asparaginase
MTAIIVYTTGGTFDALLEGDPAIGRPAAATLLANARTTIAVRCVELMRKDSSHLDALDRGAICEAVGAARERHVVVVHGTDTLVATLDALSGISGKVIVLTGAFVPANRTDSDAAFNLGAAISAAQLLPDGVYAAIGGEIYAAGSLRKDSAARRFLRIST